MKSRGQADGNAAPATGADRTGSDKNAAADEWVQCDECCKWRRIPLSVLEKVEDVPWHCSHNPDESFRGCEAPQEWSDEQIDREYQRQKDMGLGPEGKATRAKRKRPAIWQKISSNIYTHRRRRLQREDDIMICQCRPENGKGCGANCINRVLNLECVPGYCACGDGCTNQMFSGRQYTPLSMTKAGAKGYGLCAAENIKAGQFLIEYIGEVLEEEEYARRREYYAATGQRHYYFMNIGNGEVIDACRKGNLGRFINHSCEPNCETQKWVVQGELAIGLFALKDIRKGTELTFDYNFERYGDRPMQCYCGTPSCRGYIGGSQETGADVNVDSDEDGDDSEEEPVPIMLEEDVDPVMASILNKGIGIKDDLGCDATSMREKLQTLFDSNDLNIPPPKADEDDETWVERELNCALDDVSDGGGTIAHGDKLSRIRAPGRRNERNSRKKGKGRASGNSLAPTSTSNNKAGDSREDRANLREMLEDLARKQRLKNRKKVSTSPGRSDKGRKSGGVGSVSGGSGSSGGGPSSEAGKLRRYPGQARAGEGGKARGKSLDSTRGGILAEPRGGYRRSNGSIPTRLKTFVSHGIQRSDVDRRLDELATPKGQLYHPSREAIVKVLRLFNLCEIGAKTEREKELVAKKSPATASLGTATLGSDVRSGSICHSGREGYFISKDEEEIPLTARQKARVADLSLLLDVVIKTHQSSVKKLFIQFGVLSQLQQVIGRNFGPQYTVILKKILKAVDELPFTAEDCKNTQSNHGSFVCLLQALSQHHGDPDVRRLSGALLRKHNLPVHTHPMGGLESVHDFHGRFQHQGTYGRGYYGNSAQGGRGYGDRYRNQRGGYQAGDAFGRSPRLSPHTSPLNSHGFGGPSNSEVHHQTMRDWREFSRRGQHQQHVPYYHGGNQSYGSRRWDGGSHNGNHCGLMPPPRPANHFDSNRGFGRPNLGPSASMDGSRQMHPPGFVPRECNMGSHQFRGPPPPPPPPPPPLPEQNGGMEDDSMDLGEDHCGLLLKPLQRSRESLVNSTREKSEQLMKEEPDRHGVTERRPSAPYHPFLPPGIGVTNKVPTKLSEGHPPIIGSSDALGSSKKSAQLQQDSGRTRSQSRQGTTSSQDNNGGTTVQEVEVESLFQEGLYGCMQYMPGHRDHQSTAQGDGDRRKESLDNGRCAVLGEEDSQKGKNRGVKRSAEEMRRGSVGSDLSAEGRQKISKQNDAHVVPGGRPPCEQWDEPNTDFEAFVSQTLKKKLGKYLQEDHPKRITKEDADSLYKRIKAEVIAIERRAFEEHQRNNTRRPIERSKLESNIKDFVKLRVYRLYERSLHRERSAHR
ncbi:hypothetical protein BSKO_04357 [Bryopsis sp. KO-2023]|nr:hypothetical protein BSKO_04357 [Bryopsis sp. KO-2023]